MDKSTWRQILMLTSILGSLIIDILSKAWAHANLQSGIRYLFIPKLLNLTLITNTGFAFSIGQGHENIAKVISGLVLLFLSSIYIKRYFALHITVHPRLEQLGMSLILGSALGNFLERIAYGHVTDFFEFAFISFPIFNVADTLIDVGVVLIFISLYLSGKKKQKV